MKTIAYSKVKNSLADTMQEVCRDRLPVLIQRGKQEAVVMVSLADYSSLEETAYLLRSPANARRLRRSLSDLNRGKGMQVDIKSLA